MSLAVVPLRGQSRLAARLLATAVVTCCTGLDLAAQDLPTPTQNAMAGASVFGEKGCVRCHSLSGDGGSLGPDLRRATHARTFADLTASLWNHLPTMVDRMRELGIDRPRLNPQEAGDLIAFLYTLDYFEPPGDASRGQSLFTDLKCILCHRVGGVGGVVGPDLDYVGGRGVPIEIAAAMWNHAPAMATVSAARGIERPRLSGADLVDLVAYLKQEDRGGVDEDLHVLPGRALEGRGLLDDKGCTGCHGEPGDGGRIAPDLVGLERGASLTDFVAAMWNKLPAMLAAAQRAGIELPELEPREAADIVAFLYSVDYFREVGRAARGRALLDSRGCLSCHALDANGARVAPDLATLSGLDHGASIVAALWNHTVVDMRSPESGGESWPVFTGAQMADLIAALEPSTP